MIKSYYEEVFKVTETCNNGNERRITKTVLCPHFKNGRHFISLGRIEQATKALMEAGYYNIEHIETKTKKLIFVDEEATV